MPRLSQILAIEKETKEKAFRLKTNAHHLVQKANLLSGISRTYRPKDDEGERLPSESTKVQIRADDVILEVANVLTELFDVVATKEHANTEAKSNVVVDGKVILEGVPATLLLFLEKQLVDVHTFVTKLPVLDASEEWVYDEASDTYATHPTETVRTKKIPRNHVKAEATAHHPAQVDVYMEDLTQGYWSTVKYSGALPAKRIREMTDRVEALQAAVKFAREEANTINVQHQHIGKKVMDYLFS